MSAPALSPTMALARCEAECAAHLRRLRIDPAFTRADNLAAMVASIRTAEAALDAAEPVRVGGGL